MSEKVVPTDVLYCEVCKAPVRQDMEQCPVCGSMELSGYDIVNPYSTLPMQRILKICGHLLWLVGVVVCLSLLWQTGTRDSQHNLYYLIGGFIFLVVSMVFSVAFFALGELLRRVIRIQRKLRAFVEEYYTNVAIPLTPHR